MSLSVPPADEGHFYWGLKTLNICKTCSSHWEGHCLVPWVFIFCPEVQLNTDSTGRAMSCFLCCLSKVFGCTLCQEQGQTCVTSLLTETSSALGPTGSAGAALSPQGCRGQKGHFAVVWSWDHALPPQYPSPVLTLQQEVLWAQPAAPKLCRLFSPSYQPFQETSSLSLR